MEKTIMTGYHCSVVVRALKMSALVTALWVADTRSAQAQSRITPPGNSITGSPGCWRASPWSNLLGAELTCLDVIATLSPRGYGILVARAWR